MTKYWISDDLQYIYPRKPERQDVFEAIRADLSQPKQEHVVDDSGCCNAIHYPECWDTAAYPTVNDALAEMFAWFKCDNVDCAQPQAVAGGDEPKYHYNYSTALMNIEFEAFEDGFIVLKSEEGWHFKVALPTTEKYSPLPQPEAANVSELKTKFDAPRNYMADCPIESEPKCSDLMDALDTLDDIEDAMTVTTEAAKVALDALDRLVFDATSGTDDIEAIVADRELIRASLQTTASDGWMPIETAPEGKNVLVWYKGGVDVAWRYGEVWQIDTKRIEAPTHWMPLPAAPLKQSTAKDGRGMIYKFMCWLFPSEPRDGLAKLANTLRKVNKNDH